MDPERIYDYLLRARGRVLDAARALTPKEYAREFPIGLKTIASTLTHVMISEWYYVERLAGREVKPYDEWPIRYEDPPAFEVLDRTWAAQGSRVRAFIADERDWGRRVGWLGFPNEQGQRFHVSASAGGLFTQLALHEVHHRAQAMAMLRGLGRVVEDLDFGMMTFERTPAE